MTVKFEAESVLPTEAQIGLHLRLIKAFKTLKDDIQSPSIQPAATGHPKPHDDQKNVKPNEQQSFTLFLHMAVFRFERWLAGTRVDHHHHLTLPQLPPVDVLMIWHAYCLNPRWYCEDSIRLHPLLRQVKFPLELAASLIKYDSNGSIITASMDPDQELNWNRLFEKTQDQDTMYFDCRKCLFSSKIRHLDCPCCEAQISIDWTNSTETGWADGHPQIACSQCHSWSGSINDIGTARLIRDVRGILANNCTPHEDSPQQVQNAPAYPGSVAGTLTSLTNINDVENSANFARKILNQLCQESFLTRPPNSLNFNPTQVPITDDMILRTFAKESAGFPGFKRIMSAYQSAPPFSVELTSATIRQSKFVEKMVHLGYTELEQPHGSVPEFKRAIARYHSFLKLIKSDHTKFFVPTLDIDLVWHTHQLVRGWEYCTDTIECFGRLIDHNDDVEDSKLNDSFQDTATAWKSCFGVDYLACSSCKDESKAGENGGLGITRIIDVLDDKKESSGATVLGSGCGGGCGGGCGSGGCGSGGCGSIVNLSAVVFTSDDPGLESCPEQQCGLVDYVGISPQVSRVKLGVAGCGGCGSGGCGAGGCGGGLIGS